MAVAQRALALAAILDSRIPDYDPARVKAWADCFVGEDVFEAEALAAVRAHYKRPNAFPILPGDIIAAVRHMPINSSPERVMAFIQKWSAYPYSDSIQKLTGLDWRPTYPTPAGIHGDAAKEREWHIAEMRAWIRGNATQLVQAALDNPNPQLALEK